MKRHLAVLLMLGGAGCAGTQKTVLEAPAPAAPAKATLETLDSTPATETVSASDWRALGSWSATFAQLDGDDVTETVHASAPTDRFGAAWAQTAGDERTQFLAENEAGDVVMTAAIDHIERALTLFDPPLLIAPRVMALGDRHEASSVMRVVDERNHSRRREGGTCTRIIEYIERQEIRTPLGTFVAPRIDVQFYAALAFADVKQTERTWVVPGRGVVAQQRSEHLKILGMVNKRSERTVVRVGWP